MSIKTNISLITLSLSLALSASANAAPTSIAQLSPSESVAHKAQSESEKANALFESIFMENVMASPISQTHLGIKTDYDKWDEMSDAADDAALARDKKHLGQLQQIDTSKLDRQTLLSYQLLTQKLEQSIADDKWRYHNYPVNQMYGGHSQIASFLINQHQIGSVADAKAYISRLQGVPKRLSQLQTALEIRENKGIIAPKFVFPYVINDSKNIISGAPFNNSANSDDSALWSDFKRKVAKLEISDSDKDSLLREAKAALINDVKPAYDKLIAYMTKLETKADTRDGAWKFPQGDTFYNNALARTTTTDMTATEIHELGLAEVARIHSEMRAIMKKVNFEGSLNEFFKFMREDEQFYYANTTEGRQAYLSEATALIDTMSGRLDEVFKIKPKAPMIVKQVEAFREKSAGKAFYSNPSPDGSRPGTYYANLYDMKAMPKYQMEALAYHEGTPGHHMQIAIAQELEGIPKFRKFGGYTAYIEGWGLYSEYFPKEMGMYSDPYSDFGRLAMELWRACRLVVDTGIHAKKWTREESIEYYVSNTPNAKSDAVKMVERHIVMPSQATAYKVGMIKLLALRDKAQQALGDKFDIRDFHTIVLKNGPVPLDVLESEIDLWIEQSS
ncbi:MULTISPECIES: DUF885 domain-containing protein [Shewanella]|uniref:DUF885 domain-containing protein n=1 Tax=Shewanella fidelis TaxID=173509 RepID=A0AAW8NPQ9_9GAMM|nr:MULTISPECIES: DUF885 domain-containing protein [Shewanella]MDR8524697.1 DUF885 domain-containing protein [Shewanella fidelis]MDW4812172.1 DUF885 domain-containing protein [Shewanella fidelis]MDW4817373.1 DUF885 domain-containing protein [Shewanella fidelis]MDW4821440.1 DUF885 domain-containing protein [Shewanella fidelis]MDW4822779.1 DUF885 domain-containing protein [Shewanella fidelis]